MLPLASFVSRSCTGSSRRYRLPSAPASYSVLSNWQFKGSVIQEGTSIRLPFYSNKRVADGRPGSIDMTIYVCHHSIPPVYKDESKYLAPYILLPRLTIMLDVSEFARLKINLNDIPVEKLPLKRDKNEEQVYVFDYDLEMTMRSESIAFALAFEGMTYEVVETDFL